MTLDGFSFVKTKQRYEIHIYFLCMHVVPWVLKHNTELTIKLPSYRLSNSSQLQKIKWLSFTKCI